MSAKHKLIFIHIPKNAGSTFISNNMLDFKRFELLNKELGFERQDGFGNHFTYKMIKDIVDNNDVDIDYNNYFKFCIIRDPWERMGSLFVHRKRKILYQLESDAETLAKGFNYWLTNTRNVHDMLTTKTSQLEWMVDDNNDIVCDKIIRIENYSREAKEMLDQLDVPFNNDKKINVNKENTNYKELYNDSGLAHIKKYFEKDIDIFKFVF